MQLQPCLPSSYSNKHMRTPLRCWQYPGSDLLPCAPSKKWHSGELAVANLQYEVGRAPIIYRLADALACLAVMAPIGPSCH